VGANRYHPNWETDELVITPVINYGGTPKFLNALGTNEEMTITWTKRIDSGEEKPLDGTYEQMDAATGKLTVSQHPF
jgi:hypothetical protein